MGKMVGQIIADRYRIDEFIGRGGMAEVYKVWDTHRGTYLAMKLLHEDLAHDVVFLRRFKREAKNLAELKHPNIVRFYGLEQNEFLAYMLMDYIEGENLKKEIFRHQGQGISPRKTVEMIKPICSALGFAHREGLIHCDLKPGNVMINKHGEVLLADFGIARMTDAATATMVGAGTPAYMAPEQVKGLDPVPQTDIYALGVLLFEMLTGGERPFTGEKSTTTGTTSAKVRWEQVNLEPPGPRLYNPDLSQKIEAVVLKCLQKDPQDRYQTPLEVLNAIELAVDGKISPPSKAQIEEISSLPVPDHRLPISREPIPSQVRAVDSQPWYQHWGTWVGFAGIAAIFLAIISGNFKPETIVETVIVEVERIITATSESRSSSTQKLQPEVKEGLDMPMVIISAGEFQMGSEDGDSDEKPIHEVHLDAYWIDQYEVTNAQFAEFLNDQGNQEEGGETWLGAGDGDVLIEKQGSTWQPASGYEDHPVIEVSWFGARAYCEWAGKRLPTEAEWEKAARGELEGKSYPWGDEFDCSKGNFDDETIKDDYVVLGGAGCDGYNRTAPAGSFDPNGYGLYDMSGNVWEWVEDWYDEDYYGSSPTENPQGPFSGEYRVLRGGSWYSGTGSIRPAFRFRFNSGVTYDDVYGFRCAASPE